MKSVEVYVSATGNQFMTDIASWLVDAAQLIGRTGGTRLAIHVAGRPAVDCAVAEAEQVWATAIERHFAGRAA